MTSNSNSELGVPVLSIECDEPEGIVTRHVYKMILTPKNLHTFWVKSRKFVTLFGEEVRGDFHKFMEVFLQEGVNGIESRGIFWVIDDFVGIMYLTDIDAGIDAKVHYAFFDGRHRGRRDLVRAMILYVMDRYQFHRLTAEAPLYWKASAMLFAEQVGFIKEGRKRLARKFDGKWFDVNIYGILKEDTELWHPRLELLGAGQVQV